MIMPRGQQLLLPVSPLFMLFTMAFALLLDMLQSMAWTGNAAWAPDWLALVLVWLLLLLMLLLLPLLQQLRVLVLHLLLLLGEPLRLVVDLVEQWLHLVLLGGYKI